MRMEFLVNGTGVWFYFLDFLWQFAVCVQCTVKLARFGTWAGVDASLFTRLWLLVLIKHQLLTLNVRHVDVVFIDLSLINTICPWAKLLLRLIRHKHMICQNTCWLPAWHFFASVVRIRWCTLWNSGEVEIFSGIAQDLNLTELISFPCSLLLHQVLLIINLFDLFGFLFLLNLIFKWKYAGRIWWLVDADYFFQLVVICHLGLINGIDFLIVRSSIVPTLNLTLAVFLLQSFNWLVAVFLQPVYRIANIWHW